MFISFRSACILRGNTSIAIMSVVFDLKIISPSELVFSSPFLTQIFFCSRNSIFRNSETGKMDFEEAAAAG